MLSLMLCGFCAVALVAGDSSTVRVSAQASASSSEGVEVSTGTFVVEQGARLAVEIVRSDPCVCLCDPIYITDLRLLNMASEAVHQEAYEAVEMADWVGRAAFELRPVHDALMADLKRSTKLFMDETRAPVLDPGARKTKTG